MRNRRLMWMVTALFVVALGGFPALAAADKDKGKGPAKHAAGHPQKKDKDKAHKGKNKDKHDHDTRGAGTAGQEMRFRGMDANDDGVITRREWRGNDVSFANQDWNRDGVLSGDEVRPGAPDADGRRRAAPPAARPGDDPDAAIFARLDRNNDGVLSRAEWNQSAAEFARLDVDRNGVLSPHEFGVGR